MNLMINYHDHWWYKALTWLLIVAIIIMISIGAAPPAKAIGVLTATMAAAIMAVLAGAGIYTVISGMTSAEIQSWLNDKLNEWDTSRNDGNVFSDLIQNNLITATIRGTLRIGAAAASGISDFINWLTINENITDNNTFDLIESTYYLYDIPLKYGSHFTVRIDNNYTWNSNSNIPIYSVIYLVNNNYFIQYYFNDTSFYTDQYFNNDYPSRQSSMSLSNTNFYYNTVDLYNSIINTDIPIINYNPVTILKNNNAQWNITSTGSLSINTDVINIPDTSGDKVIGLEVGAFPGATTEEVTDVILNGVLDNTLDVDMVVTDELVDAQEVYIINEQPLSVNTDHHAFGFQLPDITFDFSSIWHYVTDAVTYASGFISWWVNLFTSVPILTIPLYCAFTLLVVLGAMRRFLL